MCFLWQNKITLPINPHLLTLLSYVYLNINLTGLLLTIQVTISNVYYTKTYSFSILLNKNAS